MTDKKRFTGDAGDTGGDPYLGLRNKPLNTNGVKFTTLAERIRRRQTEDFGVVLPLQTETALLLSNIATCQVPQINCPGALNAKSVRLMTACGRANAFHHCVVQLLSELYLKKAEMVYWGEYPIIRHNVDEDVWTCTFSMRVEPPELMELLPICAPGDFAVEV